MTSPHRLFQYLGPLAAILAAGQSRVAAAETMVWVMPDFPPASIPDNGQPGNGVADRVVRYIVSKWPDAEHRFIYANAKRTWQMLEQGDKVCYAAALRTKEREQVAYFTNTNVIAPPSLIVRHAALAAVPRNAAGEVDFPALLASRKLRGLLVEKRSYGAMIDGLIARSPQQSKPATTSVGNYGQKIFQMIAADRVDYTIDYDFTFSYEWSRHSELAALQTLPIAGNTALVTTGVACPRTDWGRAVITRIDRIVGTKEGADTLLQAQNAWHTEAAKQRYAAQFAEFARQRAMPAPAGEYK
ncbi:TIGR02285 family protein [Duganella sp. FT92W]|uniref:TIGR02285 family protein n=1 Tax=Pseudoduganella rivuli TaxID=2666085 RepID=A0A7X2ISS4_9BURK|nr:TIGR02285 family protein [Pseudoduganella rivuli]MRV75430.1 TIGR02285 family protein [Pseudoduganella rivuli]